MKLPVAIKAGDLLVLPEEAYQYGVGELTIRVDGIHRLSDPQWVAVDGTEIAWNNRDAMSRSVRVSVAALADALSAGRQRAASLTIDPASPS